MAGRQRSTATKKRLKMRGTRGTMGQNANEALQTLSFVTQGRKVAKWDNVGTNGKAWDKYKREE